MNTKYTGSGAASQTYSVTDVPEGMSDRDLITFCDNWRGVKLTPEITPECPGDSHHFGGHVQRHGTSATVVVYID